MPSRPPPPLLLAAAALAALASAVAAPTATAAGPGEFSAPAGVVMLLDGTVYVADTGNDRIQVFHPNGTFAFAFGATGSGEGNFSEPTGIFMSAVRFVYPITYPAQLYVADTGNDRIQVFWPNGSFARSVGTSGDGPGELLEPADVDVDWRGRIVVADTGNDRVQIFWPNGTLAHMLGSSGNGTGQFDGPRSVVADRLSNSLLFVADEGNDRVQVFRYRWVGFLNDYWSRHEATYEGTVGTGQEHGYTGTPGGIFSAPAGLDRGVFNRLIIADTGNDRVLVTSSGGPTSKFAGKFGGAGGAGNGNFSAPADVDMTRSGAFAVADTGNDRVQVFWPNGTLRFDLGPLAGGGNGMDVRPPPTQPPVAYTCSVSIGAPDLGVSVRPGEYSAPVRQIVRNSGT